MGFAVIGDFILLMLATWYITEVIVTKHGPFGLFERARDGLPHGGLLTCLYCTAIWVGAAVFLAYLYLPIIVWPFALAGGALVIRAYSGVKHDG